MPESWSEQLAGTPLLATSAEYLETLYEQYLQRPDSVEPAWRAYFASLPAAPGVGANEKQAAVARLVQIYANRGHLIAQIDPLGLLQRPRPNVLTLEYAGLSSADLDTEFYTTSRTDWIAKRAPLREIIARLEHIYCGHIGAEFAHVSNSEERLWLQDQFQLGRMQQRFSPEEQRNILQQLSAAEGLERHLHTKYVGEKRFSLEGAEALIAALNDLLQQGGRAGIEELVLGMPHRGRLNVLVNVLGKSPAQLFSEFEGHYDDPQLAGSGDVKYHKGFSADVRTSGGNVHVALAFNPSHLEIVDPVVEGSVRARQDRRRDAVGDRVAPLLMHGDAAFAGQGVVMETLQLSQAAGYRTGGTLHIVINNQIGFTTDPADARSTLYCSDIAKMIEAPILHVNADDPEAVLFCTRFALRYRQRFHKDFVVDLVCYRRHGHNEADEPAVTQPLMYRAIRSHASVRELYAGELTRAGVLSAADGEQMIERYRNGLDSGRLEHSEVLGLIGNQYTVDWSGYRQADWSEPTPVGVPLERLQALGQRLMRLPDGFTLHAQIALGMRNRGRMFAGQVGLDWGAAETLAYATLLEQGIAVRLSGQDSARGTFFHRQAVLHDQNDGRCHAPLQHVSDRQAPFTVIDSILSEEAVVGFEYGYSTTSPDCLVVWEAQFGDFVNGAQVVIDQFISSGEAKWGRLCGLTLLLPHGYEGAGPEHSSARLERFLQLCAENNMQVCVPSTPAQIFHLLRRQMLRSFRKPLIVMTPKSLLRNPLAVSSLAELSQNAFANLIGEVDDLPPAQVQRVVCCSGKVYYDLLTARRAQDLRSVALVRIEQLYPFPIEEYQAVLARYSNAADVVWCQEEPQNQGAWYHIRHRLQELAGSRTVYYAGRAAAAAPATGLMKVHQREQRRLVETALSASSFESQRPSQRLGLAGSGAGGPAAAASELVPAASQAGSASPPEAAPAALRRSS